MTILFKMVMIIKFLSPLLLLMFLLRIWEMDYEKSFDTAAQNYGKWENGEAESLVSNGDDINLWIVLYFMFIWLM